MSTVSCGQDFTLAVAQDVTGNLTHHGTEAGIDILYSWGDNSYGQLGHQTLTKAPLPMRVDLPDDI